ncbi:MAG TPA: GGDEF domain-containing response regulator [Candidatus Obscuribacter sp.]|nr:GGDEF domain-containing response regulator [Candidatus Obscuribacter sp.]HNA72220.1 GGDEF domain-containing response regulator [Candidatus Obscuribacter sp.]HNB14438.1 GGDEF domain-containing response regulator [Candidatus Obscuribacter sp.]HND65805.1 GGDEF domain-containing response regulator [Candidatus Obscuribacter sp.]HNG20698.1 GGDEF domain-containing response regulator [Candidatus Obscuribacter sp.]
MEARKTKVLLIEDGKEVSHDLKDVLKTMAHEFTMEVTDHLAGGLKVLSEGNFDVVVLDVSCSDQVSDGLSHFLKLREKDASVPVVMLGSREQDKVGSEAVKQGVKDFLVKDELDGRVLLQSIRYASTLKRMEDELTALKAKLVQTEKQLDMIANVDASTQALSRAGLERALEAEYVRAQRGGWNLVAMLIDCDDFDRINRQFGHAVGDVVLRQITERIRETVRPTDHVARMGGDEFLLILPDTRIAEGMLVAEKIRLAVGESPLRLASETVRVTASLGVLALPYEFCSIEEVLSLARLAVRESKLLGKNRVSSGEKNPSLTPSLSPDKAALDELTEKLRKGDCFRAVSMPIFHLSDEKVVGYEILSRGPAGAFEMPDDLFRVSVEHNLLTIVDLRCLKTCLSACSDPKFDQKARFHVNLFPSTIMDTPIDRLMTLFPQETHEGTFCVEISEQQFIGDPAYLKDHVHAIRKRDILVAIDDVGFGRSSLESLIILEPDIVKIDRKYVSGISADPAKARLLKRLVKVVNSIGAELIAEGIECREELELLVEMGVPFGQGWLWGKPA